MKKTNILICVGVAVGVFVAGISLPAQAQMNLSGIYQSVAAKTSSFDIMKTEQGGSITCWASLKTVDGKKIDSEKQKTTHSKFRRHPVKACLPRSEARDLLRQLK